MIRQRINLRTPALAYLVRLLTVVLGAAFIYGGAMVVLLAVKVSPHTVNSLSAYRTVYHDAAGLKPSQFTTPVSLIAGFGGLLVFLVFVYLALQQLPRPYLARGDLDVADDGRGRTEARPRAIERVAEVAAGQNPDVTKTRGRLGDHELDVDITVSRARTLADVLPDVQQRVVRALAEHELPDLDVNVTIVDFDQKTRRELS